ncbi:hypothetical protein GCM10007242_45610 [Pigmentiphaga litoralis]|nr:hypothetical protein GCM10007242_45610 [Pigmentiphaga litoralis]
MRPALYDHWPQYMGRHLRAVAPWGTFEGVLVGLKPPIDGLPAAPNVALPWAISGPDGIVHLLDPDNPAVTLYIDGKPIEAPPRPAAPAKQDHLRDLLNRCQDFLARLRGSGESGQS